MPINPKQLAILVALAHAGEGGLTLNEIRLSWGWDGSNTDKLKFERDLEVFFDKNSTIRFLKLRKGAAGDAGMMTLSSADSYHLNESGRDYLIDNNLI